MSESKKIDKNSLSDRYSTNPTEYIIYYMKKLNIILTWLLKIIIILMKYKTSNKKEAVLLFSGGRDSSLAAVQLIEMGFEIHLLTFDNGATQDIAKSNLRLSEFDNNVKMNIIKRKIVNSRELFKKIALTCLEKDIVSYKTNLICMGCKMAMHTISLNYCLKNGIGVIADGYTYYQREWPEQMPPAIKEIKKFHNKYGIEYINPVYNLKSKETAKEKLTSCNLSVDSLEGECIFGGTFSTPNEMDVVEYIKEKIKICEKYLSIEQPSYDFEKYEEAIVVSFCLLNQFMRADGAKKYTKNLHVPILEWAIDNNIAIIPLPCPEYSYEGINRKAAGIEKYDTPDYNKHCKELANKVIPLLKDHTDKGIYIKAIVGVDGSPSCGVNYSINNSKKIKRPGIFINKIMNQSANLNLNFIGIHLGKKDYFHDFELFKLD